jgi:hypothetical protein
MSTNERCALRGLSPRVLLLLPLGLSALTGCDPWGRLQPADELWLDEALWSDQLVAAGDRVYVTLPAAGALLEIAPDGAVREVDLEGAAPAGVVPLPAGAEAFVFVRWPVCTDADQDIVLVDECPSDALEEASELRLVAGHQTITTDAEGRNDRAVVLSTSQVVVVDVATADVLVTYPLALDVDTVIVPDQALVAGGGRYCLLAVAGGRELYRLDLVNESIDIEDLDGVPALLAELPLGDEGAEIATLVGYSDRPALDVLDGLTNERVQRFELDHPVNRSLQIGQTLVAWSTLSPSYKDVYIIDLETSAVDEQRAGNPLRRLEATEDGRFLVGLMNQDSGSAEGGAQDDLFGLFVMELGARQPTNLALASAPVGLAISTREGQSFALLLLEGDDQLYKVDLSRPSFATPVELPAPARSLVALDDGRVAIALSSAVGLVSFYDPASDAVQTVAGFASLDLLAPPELPRRAD